MKAKVIVTSGNGIAVHHRGRKICLDPSTPTSADVVFVSHAHIDHTHTPSDGEKILTSKETAVLAKERGFNLQQVHESLEGFQLIDSGHVLGSRSLLIDGEIFYTGDFAGRPRGFLPKGRAIKCSTLIMESTYGMEGFRFPPVAGVLKQVNELISELFSRGIPVVLMGYPLGKAQLITYLFSSWDPIYVHGAVQRMNEVHVKLGVNLRSDLLEYSEASRRGLLNRKPWILISPMRSNRTSFVQGLKKKYGAVTVAFTGWSVESKYRYAMGSDYAFPLSDHCDFDDLTKLVESCEPEKVYTIHGFSTEFASHLRRRGFDAEPLLGVQKSMVDYVGNE